MSEFVRNQNRTADNSLLRPAQRERTAAEPAHALNPQPLGNQAAQQFSESCPRALPSPGLCPFGGACHTCPARVQTKLTVSQPDDPYEQEADRVAEQVMTMPEPRVQRACPSCEDEILQKKPLAEQITPLVQRQKESEEEEEEPVQTKTEEGTVQRQEESEEEEPVQAKSEDGAIQRQKESEEEEEPVQTKLEDGAVQRQEEHPDEEEEPVQTKSIDGSIQRQEDETEEEEPAQAMSEGGHSLPLARGLDAEIQSVKGEGQPLSQGARDFFEPRFGRAFGDVRVHADEQATKASQALNARAFTVGRNIAFGKGWYAPGTPSGDSLLAHELVHVMQQNTSRHHDVARFNLLRSSGRSFVQRYQLRGFPPTQKAAMELAIPVAVGKVNKGKNLSRLSKFLITRALQNRRYDYKINLKYCGWTFPSARYIQVGKDAFNPKICCDLASTLAHEAAHTGAWFLEKRARKMECKCFGCSC
jgi:hypothetical protein